MKVDKKEFEEIVRNLLKKPLQSKDQEKTEQPKVGKVIPAVRSSE